MGTNFYLHQPVCPTCGRERGEKRHIGKSSGGWTFALHVYPDEGINTLEDWKRLFANDEAIIKNEYGDIFTMGAMLGIISNRAASEHVWSEVDLALNHAVPGPNNLARRRIDWHCIGHGEGTYDLCVGEFS